MNPRLRLSMEVVGGLLLLFFAWQYFAGPESDPLPEKAQASRSRILQPSAEEIKAAEDRRHPRKTQPQPKESVTGGLVDSTYITIPASFLDRMHLSMFWEASLSDDDAEKLNITGKEAQEIVASAKRAVEALAKLESERAELRRDHDGGEYYFIPALGKDGDRIRAQLGREISKIADPGVSALLMQATAKSDYFADFGRQEREVSFVVKGDHDFLEIQTYDEFGVRRGFRATRVSSVPYFEERYGAIFRRRE